MSFILDTDLRGRLDMRSHVTQATSLFITTITVSELVYGAYKSDRPSHHLLQINHFFNKVTILPFETDAAYLCGEIKDKLRRAGTPLAEPDLQIASVALSHTLPLATHNQKHFQRIPGLTLVDWLA